MFDYETTTNRPAYRGALEIEAQSRKQEKQIAILVAEYEADMANVSTPRINPFKNLFANLFGGMKVSAPRDMASATNK